MKYIDGKKLELEVFLKILLSKYKILLVPNHHFPTDQMLNDFLQSIGTRTDNEIKEILAAFFIKNGTSSTDLLYKKMYETNHPSKIFTETQYFKRLMSHTTQTDTVWEGITWIIDLLPNFPNEALRSLEAYYLANIHFLPDSYHIAIQDWSAIIRAKYINMEVSSELFLTFEPKEFEFIIAELYETMGYKTTLTQSSHDGGVDVIAEKNKIGKKEKLLIQCKRYKSTIGVPPIRELLGVVSNSNATKGTLITCSDFSIPARKLAASNSRIELINIKGLTQLLNLHLGPLWPSKVDRFVMKQKSKTTFYPDKK